jgi:glycerol-1-phosphatase
MHAECVRRTGARRPLVVGDRLDTDVEGGRRAGAATLLVLTGVTDPATLLAAGPDQRPDLLAPDAGGLLHRHAAVVAGDGGWRCGEWAVRGDGDGPLLLGRDAAGGPAGSDGLDGLRALCVAHWARHPGTAAPARVAADDEAAAAALRRWALAS